MSSGLGNPISPARWTLFASSYGSWFFSRDRHRQQTPSQCKVFLSSHRKMLPCSRWYCYLCSVNCLHLLDRRKDSDLIECIHFFFFTQLSNFHLNFRPKLLPILAHIPCYHFCVSLKKLSCMLHRLKQSLLCWVTNFFMHVEITHASGSRMQHSGWNKAGVFW